jgi:hypothetical protein
MSVKYTLVPMLAVFALIYFWLRRREDTTRAFKETLSMITVAVVIFAPWLVKNMFFYGNPFYPFLNRLVGRISPADWNGFLADTHSQNLARTLSSVAGWKEFIMRPWTMSMGERELDDDLGKAFIAFVPWALCLRWGILKKNSDIPATWTTIALLSTAAYFTWALSSGLVRFMVPTLPFISCLAALSIMRTPIPNWLRRAAWIVCLFVSVINMLFICGLGSRSATGIWPQILDNTSRSVYLKTSHLQYPSPYYAAMEYINQSLPREAKVLFLGESRSYYCERDFVAATVFDHNPFWVAAQEAQSADDLFGRVKNMGITHIFVSANTLYIFANRRTVMPKDIVAGKMFEDFCNRYLETVFDSHQQSKDGAMHNWLVVYRLLDKPNSSHLEPHLNLFHVVLDSLPK